MGKPKDKEKQIRHYLRGTDQEVVRVVVHPGRRKRWMSKKTGFLVLLNSEVEKR